MTFSYFSCFFFLFSQYFSSVSCYIKQFSGGVDLFLDFFSFVRRALSSTIKIRVQIIAFNKKTVVKVLRIFNSKSPPWNLVKFRIELGKCLKNTVRNLYLHIYSISLRLDVSSLTKIQHFQLRQSEREHIPMKIWHLKCFIHKDSSDDQSAFDGLKFFEFAVAWISAIKNKTEIIFNSNNYFYKCIANKKREVHYMSLGYCAPHLSLVFKLNSFFSLALFSLCIHHVRQNSHAKIICKLKETCNSCFFVTPKNHRLMFASWKN